MLTARQLQQCACACAVWAGWGALRHAALQSAVARVFATTYSLQHTSAGGGLAPATVLALMELRCAAHLAFLVACHHNIGTTIATTTLNMNMSSCLELRGALLMMTCLSLNERALKSTLRRRSQTPNHFTHHGDEHRAPKKTNRKGNETRSFILSNGCKNLAKRCGCIVSASTASTSLLHGLHYRWFLLRLHGRCLSRSRRHRSW